jgi:hypothetical protein
MKWIRKGFTHYFLIHQTQSDELHDVLPRGEADSDMFQIVLSGWVGMIWGVFAEDGRCVRIDLGPYLARASPAQALALHLSFLIGLPLVSLFPTRTLARTHPEPRGSIDRASV